MVHWFGSYPQHGVSAWLKKFFNNFHRSNLVNLQTPVWFTAVVQPQHELMGQMLFTENKRISATSRKYHSLEIFNPESKRFESMVGDKPFKTAMFTPVAFRKNVSYCASITSGK